MKEKIKELLECFCSEDIHVIQCEHKWCDAYGYEKSQMKKDLLDYITNLQQENERLKYWLNDVIFDENNIDVELAARYLRKLGYIDFDDVNKVYINKHNNSPLMQEDNKEKAFYLKDEELSEYTKQLESQNKDYKSRCKKAIEYIKENYPTSTINYQDDKYKLINILNGSDENETNS